MKRFTKSHEQQLIALAKTRKYFWSEIAKKLNVRPATICFHARRLGLPKHMKRRGVWNRKYSHGLRLRIARYYLRHTARETATKFKLSHGQIIGVIEMNRRSGLFKNKDRRVKAAWTGKEYQFLLQHAGLKRREWIAHKLKRNILKISPLVVKERLAKLGIASRTLNGLTLTMYREAFGSEPRVYVRTSAGPGRGGMPTYFKIVPWFFLDQEIKAKRIKAPHLMKKLIHSMALFQKWIWDGKPGLRLSQNNQNTKNY